ncbi:unnamed protein product [Dimorphilus gyrociliatus]|uniref:Uncharacterized protein n=1 Tax=Dimorphilus gyrociliatus TaxID=2664684 RepID=A0A7I8VHK0_9ANNE|nr:unnamed protein product [Dimorphilus gyrociliatus]
MNLEGEECKNIFKECLPVCCNLKEIHLNFCQLSPEVGEYIGIFIGHQTQLSILNLSNTNLEDDIGRCMFENITPSCCGVRELNMKGCKFCPKMSGYLCKFIGYQTQLVTLNLEDTNLKGDIGRNLFQNTSPLCCNIEKLYLIYCKFSPEMSEHLGKFIGNQKYLKVINFKGTDLKGDIGNNIFRDTIPLSYNLRSIDLSHCEFSSEMSENLGKFIGRQIQLTRLKFFLSNLKSDIGMNIFRNISKSCCNLEYLSLSSCYLSLRMSKYLGEFIGRQTKLKTLLLDETNIKDDIGKNIFQNTPSSFCNLNELHLNGCNLTADMSGCLGSFIGNQTQLEILLLIGIDLRNDIGKNLFQSISSSCNNLKKLILNYCLFSQDMSQHLAVFIQRQKRLNTFEFFQTNLKGDIGKDIIQSIPPSCRNLGGYSNLFV